MAQLTFDSDIPLDASQITLAGVIILSENSEELSYQFSTSKPEDDAPSEPEMDASLQAVMASFAEPASLTTMGDALAALCTPGSAQYILVGDQASNDFAVTDDSGATLLSSETTEWTQMDGLDTYYAMMVADASQDTLHLQLQDEDGNGWNAANPAAGNVVGGVWLHHPNGDVELLKAYTQDNELNLDISIVE